MKKEQIAAQLYTLRDYLKTPEDVAKSLIKVKKAGYDTVQVSGMCALPEEELNKMLNDAGLKVCATHENGRQIAEDIDSVIARLKKLNCTHTAYGYPHMFPKTPAEAAELGRILNRSAIKMAENGLTLSYHNHALEFERLDGKLMLDVIYKNAPLLNAELDIFWVQAGGGNPIKWIKKMANRQVLIHLKEYGIIDNNRVMLPVGSGNFDWKKIISAADKAGVEWFIVEQDDTNGMDPFEALKISYDYIVENLVK